MLIFFFLKTNIIVLYMLSFNFFFTVWCYSIKIEYMVYIFSYIYKQFPNILWLLESFYLNCWLDLMAWSMAWSDGLIWWHDLMAWSDGSILWLDQMARSDGLFLISSFMVRIFYSITLAHCYFSRSIPPFLEVLS